MNPFRPTTDDILSQALLEAPQALGMDIDELSMLEVAQFETLLETSLELQDRFPTEEVSQ